MYLLSDLIRILSPGSLGKVSVILEVVTVDSSKVAHADHVSGYQRLLHVLQNCLLSYSASIR